MLLGLKTSKKAGLKTGFRYFLSFPQAQGFVPRQNRYEQITFFVIFKHDRFDNQERNLIVKPTRKRSLRLCLPANQHTLCSLLMKGQTPKRQAVQRLRIYIAYM